MRLKNALISSPRVVCIYSDSATILAKQSKQWIHLYRTELTICVFSPIARSLLNERSHCSKHLNIHSVLPIRPSMVLSQSVVKDSRYNPLSLVLMVMGLEWIEKPHIRKTGLSTKKKKKKSRKSTRNNVTVQTPRSFGAGDLTYRNNF